ncbi:hypothetical protein BDF22DRAFT_688348 [Syncephalis plumigaleata]|nr:hypothetical protein BDF22DRAFT_688348 [Syncephalis plumigaleata]
MPSTEQAMPDTANVDQKKIGLSLSEAIPTLQTRVSGRTWKSIKKPSHRSMMAKALKTTWSARQAERTKKQELKRREDEIRAKTEIERQVNIASRVDGVSKTLFD